MGISRKNTFLKVILCIGVVASTGCKSSKNATESTEYVSLDTMDISIPVEAVYDYQATPARSTDIIHTVLELSFDWENEAVEGLATITAKPHFYPLDTVILDAKGFEIHKVESNSAALKYLYDRRQLKIILGKTYTRSDTFTLTIGYTARPSQLPKGGSRAITSDQGMYFINAQGEDPETPMQIWTQGETEANSGWFPTVDKPNEKMTQEIYLTVDKKFRTISNGRLIYSIVNADGTRTDYWKQSLPHAPYLTMVAIGEFAEVEDSWEGMQVNYYLDSAYRNEAMALFGNTPEMLSFYSNLLGYRYPWEKYDQVVVKDFVSGAMENTTAVIFGDFVQLTQRELIDYNFEEIVAHELFHHWFGDLVTTESWSNLALNEAFATYGEYLWIEHKYGREEADLHLMQDLQAYLNESQSKNVDLIRFYYGHREDMFDSHSYAKGGRVLHMLRNYVGDEAFFAALNHYLNKHEYGTAEIHDLRIAFEEITGKDLNWFFNQWFLDKGHPKVNIRYVTSADSLTVEITQNQNLEDFPLYKLPLDIAIYEGGSSEPRIEKVVLNEKHNRFSFPARDVSLAIADATQMMLWEKTEEKPSSWWRKQYQHGELFLDRYEALRNLHFSGADSIADHVTYLALGDPFWNIRQQAIGYIDLHLASAYPNIKDRLASIARSDPKSLVRGSALTALSELYPDDPLTKNAFAYALNDSSIVVLGTALQFFSEKDPEKALEEAEKLEGLKASGITTAIAGIYASAASEEKAHFFQAASARIEGPSAMEFAVSYYSYATRLENPEILTGLQAHLSKMVSGGKNWWIKYSGMAGLKELQRWHESKASEGQADNISGQNPAYHENQVAELSMLIDSLVEREEDEKLKQMFRNL